jgi:trimeric autotransporter adhesin
VAGAVVVFGLPAVTGTAATAAQPVPGHTRLVPITARTDTPRITNREITDIEVIGNRVFIAGSFTSIANRQRNDRRPAQPCVVQHRHRPDRHGFRPTFDGGVDAIEASPDGTSLYVAGSFNTVGGAAKRKIVRLNPANGAPVAAFNANARATALAVSNTTVYVGGRFTASTGSPVRRSPRWTAPPAPSTPGSTNPLTGGLGVGGLLTVQQLKLTHNDAKLLVVHTGRQIAGQDRYGVGLIDTATKALLPWRTRLWEDNLSFVGGIQRIFAGDIAPDDSYFVVSSGSGGDRPPINDTAISFPLTGNDNVQPNWVSRHFDSVYSVAITESAVYVGGHFNWQESPTSTVPWPGLDNVGYGTGQGLSGYGLGDQVVRRDHLGALDPRTGTALEWHPGSNSFQGDKAMKATRRGLFVGGDGNTKGGQNTGRVAFFDVNRAPATSAVDTTITAPIEGQVRSANAPSTIEGRATAPGGVARVQVELQNRGSKQWLQDDLRTWGKANSVNAVVAAVNATSTGWSLPVSLPVGEYLVQAQTFARTGGSDPSKAAKKIEN